VDPDSRRLHVTVTDGRGRAVRDGGLARWLAAVAPARARGEVAVAIVSDAHSRRLNRAYRAIDAPTDVLSFPSRQFPVAGRLAPFLGDIVIASGLAKRQARERGHAPATELRILALHGLLHLLGYDHERPGDHGRMARAETGCAAGRPAGRAHRARPQRRAGPPAGVGPAWQGTSMIPVLLLLLAAAAVYVGTIETSFSTLMKLSLRLMAERGGRDDRLGYYLDDPHKLFLPARLMLGIIFSLATMSIAILTGGPDRCSRSGCCCCLWRSSSSSASTSCPCSSPGAIPSACSRCCCRPSTSPRGSCSR
jgi:rRNA maturation RNase YbeY